MDDEFDLFRESPRSTPPARRPLWLLLSGAVVVALLAVVGVFWMVSSVTGRGGTVSAAATPQPPATSVAAPATTVAAATGEPAPPTTTVPAPPTATFTVPVKPLPSAHTVAPPKPKPKPTPRPTLSTPVGKLVTVPDVTGLRVKPATAALTAAGLKVQVLGGLFTTDRDDRRVTSQRPTAGSVVRAGSTVILVTDGL